MGPLSGMRVVGFAGIGPAPFAAMLLGDLGADVIRIDRPGATAAATPNLLHRNKRSIVIDMQRPEGVDLALRLVAQADALIEGFRPGVMERLGVGPEPCHRVNPGLIYGRMTGWGQDGPLARAAGHDINYVALAGALYHIGMPGGPPVPPLNLVGDFGGGGLLLAFGVLAALVQRVSSGKGQVVDAAMVDGAALLTTASHTRKAAGTFSRTRGRNVLDGGAHFYGVYETADNQYVSVGSMEPQFYRRLLDLAGLSPEELGGQYDPDAWPEARRRVAAVFKTKTQEEWRRELEGTDLCFAPVLSIEEAPNHPHNRARNTFIEVGGIVQPAPAPRFSSSAPSAPVPPAEPGKHTDEILSSLGVPAAEIAAYRSSGIVR